MNIIQKIISIFGKVWHPVKANMMFMIFMYALGVIVTYVTLPPYKTAKIYENTFYELFFDLYVVAFLLWIIPKKIRGWVRALCYVVAYTLAIIDCFCFVKFGATIGTSMLLLMKETNGSEATEFLETYITWDLFITNLGWVFLLLALHIIITLLSKTVKKKGWLNKWAFKPDASAMLLIDVVLSTAVIMGIKSGWEDTLFNKKGQWELMNQKTIADMEKTLLKPTCGQMYQPVYRLAMAIRSNQLIDQQIDKLKAHLDNVNIDSCSHKSQNIVLIIGESYNKNHSQLYGYEKPTTPRQVKMEKSGRLTRYNDVVTPWNLTSYVFKHLMTTYCAGDQGEWCDYPFFCQLFRKAGYQVNFITNQFIYHAKDAVYDASGGFFLNDKVLSEAQFDVRNEETHLWDTDLLKDYNRLVGDGERKNGDCQLTIFHLIGQHVNYRIRCPKSKQPFFPKDYNLPNNTPKEVRNIAFYDSSVWFNDSVVTQIVDRFKDDDAIIIYFSDHGEEVYGPGSLHHCGRRHTTNITRTIASQEYEIPMWIYCTDKYSTAHPEISAAVKASANKPFMIDAVSHLLLGLAGIDCKYYRPDYDLLNPQYDVQRKRMMQRAVDYNELLKEKDKKKE